MLCCTSRVSRLLRRFFCASVMLVASGSLAGCRSMIEGARQAPKDAEALDASVHASMARGDWKSVYASADPDLREAATPEKFGALFTAVSTKLGQPVSSTQTSWRMNATASGTYLHSECETKFSKNATANESFTRKKSGDGKYALVGYNINSDDLITR
jgi:hypothetical protein